MNYEVRSVAEQDYKEIHRIYAPYVRDTAISFEVDVPSEKEIKERIAAVSKKYPYLVCVEDRKIIGYAYASEHQKRAAYCYGVDVSIYLEQNRHSEGFGTLLYKRLFELLAKQGYMNAYAGITLPNEKSCKLHEKFGFVPVGTYHKTGYKFGRWYDVLWMEKRIRETLPQAGILDIRDIIG
ncbi:GNAT family N-acetyltransferase [Christensenella tenuis]|uniref:N-acetyltransferase n=1 Tax=Christensenella tenuis TaxID=2763033 RepID=A0ABR7EH41_9FIRM|nr:GNAT family N-acetyltransferase [Christensenella tenuis]MBC5648666.1 N-acetyltransferase [Christensenella tenuis]